MLSRRALTARSIAKLHPNFTVRSMARTYPEFTARYLSSTRHLKETNADINVLDPGLNGGYPNPPARKRQLRDPYGKYWDSQERRNYGEPVHEDNDILGIFTTEQYTWTNPKWGFVLFGTFLGALFSLMTVVKLTYPDTPMVPREFDLVEELGGKEALLPTKNLSANEAGRDA